MQEKLTRSLQNEKKKLVMANIIKAFILASIILVASFAIMNLMDTGTGPDNIDPTDQNDQVYVNQISNRLSLSMENGNIDGFEIVGNASTIHPELLFSIITPNDNDNWNVFASLMNTSSQPVTPYEQNYNVASSEINNIHDEFINSLNNTDEVNVETPIQGNFIMFHLGYRVYFDDSSILTFSWINVDGTDYLQISHSTWSGTIENSSIDESTEEHYLSPLSAFDTFIDSLVDFFDEIIV